MIEETKSSPVMTRLRDLQKHMGYLKEKMDHDLRDSMGRL